VANKQDTKKEIEMTTKFSDTKSKIQAWIGNDGETLNHMTDEQADNLLNWLEENEIDVSKNEDVDKLQAWMEAHGM
jgi:hypothetical protein